MRQMRNILTATFFIFWILTTSFKLIIQHLLGNNIEIFENFTFGLITATLIMLGFYLGMSVTIKSKLKYLESENENEPTFLGVERIEFINSNNLSIDNLVNRQKGKYIISFVNKEKGIIKMRTKFNVNSWGVGFYIEQNLTSKKINCISFPLVGGSNMNKKEIESLKKIIEKE
jgi:hypothetical protein